MPTFAGYVLAAGAMAWVAGFGWLPLIVGGVAVAVNEQLALRRAGPGEGPGKP
jgi:uncharacterized membrane protein YhhN